MATNEIEPFFKKETTNVDRMNEDYKRFTVERGAELSQELAADIAHQINKFGPQRLNVYGWLAVCVEESGEVAKEYMQGKLLDAVNEAKQTAACYLRLAMEIERELRGLHDNEWFLYSDPV